MKTIVRYVVTHYLLTMFNNTNKEVKDDICRSRFALFINHIKRDIKRRRHRYREPSRIPIKALKKALKRRNRKFVKKYILKSVPKSSFVYQIMKVASLRKTVVYSIRKAMEEYTCGQAKKRARAYINKYRRRDYSVLRKIHHASNENFNPYIITNKEAHLSIKSVSKYKVSIINEQSQQAFNITDSSVRFSFLNGF